MKNNKLKLLLILTLIVQLSICLLLPFNTKVQMKLHPPVKLAVQEVSIGADDFGNIYVGWSYQALSYALMPKSEGDSFDSRRYYDARLCDDGLYRLSPDGGSVRLFIPSLHDDYFVNAEDINNNAFSFPKGDVKNLNEADGRISFKTDEKSTYVLMYLDEDGYEFPLKLFVNGIEAVDLS